MIVEILGGFGCRWRPLADGEPDVRAVELLRALAHTVEHPRALGARRVDPVEVVVPLEQRRDLLHDLSPLSYVLDQFFRCDGAARKTTGEGANEISD
jgi:hypothetical protein